MSRERIGLALGGALGGLVLALVGWLWLGSDRCETTGHERFAEWTGANGLTRYVPDGCQNDANGYRNARVPERADVVALGDSNTWGASVGRAHSWPNVLARESGLTVYNMSMGGWGPVEFAAALPEALTLRPRLVIVALYLGNDIYNAYASLARPVPAAAYVQPAIPVPAEIATDWIADVAETEAKDNGMIYAESWTAETYAARARSAPEHLKLLRVGSTPLQIHPVYRLYGVDLDEPRIRFGLDASKRILTQLAQSLAGGDTRLLVAILPSKELVYCPLFDESRASGAWSRICRFEERIETEIVDHLRSLGVDSVSATSEFRRAAAAGVEIYPGMDTHTGRVGTALFAEIVERFVRELER